MTIHSQEVSWYSMYQPSCYVYCLCIFSFCFTCWYEWLPATCCWLSWWYLFESPFPDLSQISCWAVLPYLYKLTLLVLPYRALVAQVLKTLLKHAAVQSQCINVMKPSHADLWLVKPIHSSTRLFNRYLYILLAMLHTCMRSFFLFPNLMFNDKPRQDDWMHKVFTGCLYFNCGYYSNEKHLKQS